MEPTLETLLEEDALALLEKVREADLVLTDPPYGTTRLPWDREPPWRDFLALAREALSERGNLVLFASGRAVYRVLAALEELSWPWYELVWPKRAPTGFYDAGRRPLRAHEWVIVAPRTWGRSLYRPQRWSLPEGGSRKTVRRRANGPHWGKAEPLPYLDDGTRFPLSLLPPFTLSPEEKAAGGHPTQKPLALGRYLVETYSEPGSLVVDPYAGSGTFGVAALELGRRFVGAEREARWRELALRRLRGVAPRLL